MKRKVSELDGINPYERVQNLKRFKLSQERKISLEELFSTRDILIVNKPYDLHLDGNHSLTLKKLVITQFSKFLDPVPVQNPRDLRHPKNPIPPRKVRYVHQLDYATSGVIVLAFTRRSCGKVGSCFINRTIRKQYLAIVFGHVEKNEQIIESRIGKDPNDPNKFMERNFPNNSSDGRMAKTKCVVLKRGIYDGKEVTKVHLLPESGRRHQLRLHMKLIGHPILGDCTYAKDGITKRMCLHAYKLFIPLFNPKGTWISTKDPFEEDFL